MERGKELQPKSPKPNEYWDEIQQILSSAKQSPISGAAVEAVLMRGLQNWRKNKIKESSTRIISGNGNFFSNPLIFISTIEALIAAENGKLKEFLDALKKYWIYEEHLRRVKAGFPPYLRPIEEAIETQRFGEEYEKKVLEILQMLGYYAVETPKMDDYYGTGDIYIYIKTQDGHLILAIDVTTVSKENKERDLEIIQSKIKANLGKDRKNLTAAINPNSFLEAGYDDKVHKLTLILLPEDQDILDKGSDEEKKRLIKRKLEEAIENFKRLAEEEIVSHYLMHALINIEEFEAKIEAYQKYLEENDEFRGKSGWEKLKTMVLEVGLATKSEVKKLDRKKLIELLCNAYARNLINEYLQNVESPPKTLEDLYKILLNNVNKNFLIGLKILERTKLFDLTNKDEFKKLISEIYKYPESLEEILKGVYLETTIFGETEPDDEVLKTLYNLDKNWNNLSKNERKEKIFEALQKLILKDPDIGKALIEVVYRKLVKQRENLINFWNAVKSYLEVSTPYF